MSGLPHPADLNVLADRHKTAERLAAIHVLEAIGRAMTAASEKRGRRRITHLVPRIILGFVPYNHEKVLSIVCNQLRASKYTVKRKTERGDVTITWDDRSAQQKGTLPVLPMYRSLHPQLAGPTRRLMAQRGTITPPATPIEKARSWRDKRRLRQRSAAQNDKTVYIQYKPAP